MCCICKSLPFVFLSAVSQGGNTVQWPMIQTVYKLISTTLPFQEVHSVWNTGLLASRDD